MKKKLILVALVLVLGLVLFGVNLKQAVAQADAPTDVPVYQIIIKYKAEANLNEAAQAQASVQMARLSEAAGVTLGYFRPMSGDAHVLKLPAKMPVDEALQISAQLSALPEVEYAEPDYVMFPIGDPSEAPLLIPNDTYYGYQWHYFDIYGVNAPAAWDITTGSNSVYVAVLDTGVLDHEDLNGRWTGGYDFITDPSMANDGGGRDADPHDPGDWVAANECGYIHSPQISSWHGTHVGGTIGAATNNATGVAGLNWVSQFVPVRVLGKCGGLTSDIADGIRWAAGLPVAGAPTNSNPAQVINMSLGGQGDCSSTYQSAIDAAYGAGSAIVVAAGNNNEDAGGFRPANCNNVITVAATDRNGNRAYYSNYGSVVEISAPGGDTSTGTNGENGVLSTLNDGVQGPGNDIYVYYQGTSMAAPHVAGIASLLYSRNPSLVPAQVMTILQNTVTAFPAGSTCNTSICGSGIVNAAAALASALPLEAPVLDTISNPDGDGDYTVNWNDVSGATGYTLQVDDNSSFLSPVTAYSGAASQYDVSGQMPGMWYYRVRASDGSGNSDWSNTVSVAVKPPAPTLNPISNPGDADAYSIDWSTSVGADGYLLEEADNPSFTGASTRYMGVNAQYDVTGQAGGTWYYRVNAYADSVDSDWSNLVTTTVTASYLDAPVLAPIDNADGDGDYTVQWSDVTSATSYILEESDNQYFVNPLVVYSGTLTQTAIIDQEGGDWFYRVRAADAVEKGPWSNSQSVEVFHSVFLPVLLNQYQEDLGFNSQFTDNADGWVTHGGSWVLNGGYYRTVGVPDYGSSISYARTYNSTSNQMYYQARVYRAGCDTCANRLLIYGTPDPLDAKGRWYSQYLFQYVGQGYYSIFKIVGADIVTLIDWTESSAINTGNAWNTLGVLEADGILYFYINSELTAVGPVEPDLTSGRVGIGMYRAPDSTGDEFYVDWATLTTLVSSVASSPSAAVQTWSGDVDTILSDPHSLDYFIP